MSGRSLTRYDAIREAYQTPDVFTSDSLMPTLILEHGGQLGLERLPIAWEVEHTEADGPSLDH